MGIRRLFNSNWSEVLAGASIYDDTEVLAEQRVIIMNRNCGKVVWGQLVMMFDENDNMALITARYCIPPLAFPAHFHTLEQRGRLLKEGIICKVVFERGLVTVTYSRAGWLERVAQRSSVQGQQEQSLQTQSVESTNSGSQQT